MSDALKSFMSTFVTLSDEEYQFFFQQLQAMSLKKGQHLVKAGAVATRLGFVTKGLFKVYFLNSDGQEYITNFVSEGNVVGAYSDVLLSRPTKVQIQALENSDLIYIDYSFLLELYKRHSCWQEFGRKIAEKLFIEREEREWHLATLSAEARYDLFCKQHPSLIDRLAQNQIALYLGINAVSLSRIRNRRASKRVGG